MGYYIDAAGQKALKEYKYSGSDLSLTYKYVLSPLAQFCVDKFTPVTMAPNTITFLGLLGMFCSYCVMWWYCPGIEEAVVVDGETTTDNSSIPRWIFLFNCLMMLFYQTMDNMDGKQARKTGNGTPLGMLFDHGCDAINSPMGSVCWAVAMGVGPAKRLVMFCTLTSSAIPFYTSTWEEYYTGALVLPIINGPNEGLLLGAGLSFVSYLWGPSYWHSYSWSDAWLGGIIEKVVSYGPPMLQEVFPSRGLQNCEILVAVGFICAAQEFVLKVSSIVRKYGLAPLLTLIPFIVMIMGSVLLFTTDVGSTILANNPRTSMLLFGILFVEMVCGLMLDHMTKKVFSPFRPILFPLVLLTAVARGYIPGLSLDFKTFEQFYQQYFAGAFVFLAFRLTIVGSEICQALNIWCFDIVNKRKKEKML